MRWLEEKSLLPLVVVEVTNVSELCAEILRLLFDWIDMLASWSLQTKLFMSIGAFLCASKRFNEIVTCCVSI